MKDLKIPLPKENTLEGLIENLDQRGVLILLVLLGQQAMKVLSQEHIAKVTKPSILKPEGPDL
jgi:hypothetical protein